MVATVQLSDFEHFAKRVELDLDSKEVVQEFVLPDDADKRRRYSMDGVYLITGNNMVAFFRNGSRMNLLVGKILYEDLDLVTAEYERCNESSHLIVFLRGISVHDLVYTPIDYGIPPELDFTAFWEPEHDDFFLFLYNVLSSPCRRDACFDLKSKTAR